MDNEIFGIPTKTVVTEEEKTFLPDYKYADSDSIKAVTTQQLAKLEVDLHSLRLVLIANGGNSEALIGQNRTLGAEISRIESTIKTVENYFSSILK